MRASLSMAAALFLLPLGISADPQDEKRAQELHKRGREREKKGDLDGAIADYTEAIRLDPRDPRSYRDRGRARDKKGDHKGALADYVMVWKLNQAGKKPIRPPTGRDPKSADEYRRRGREREAKGDLAGAIADYTKAIELDPKSTGAWVDRGRARRKKGDYKGAIEDHTQAIERDPWEALPYRERGKAKEGKGDPEGAIKDYTKAIALDAEKAETYADRGRARAKKGDRKGAIADYTKAIERSPKDARPYRERGRAKEEEKDLDGAIADYEAAVRLDPKDAEVRRDLERAKKKKAEGKGKKGGRPHTATGGNWEGGIWTKKPSPRAKAGRRDRFVVKLDPKHKEANEHLERGWELRDRGDLRGAIEEYKKAVALYPGFVWAHASMGCELRALGRPEEAMAAFGKAIELSGWGKTGEKTVELDPMHGHVFFLRGDLRLAREDFKGAAADFTRAIEIRGEDPWGYALRAMARERLKDYDGAVGDLKTALETSKPDWPRRAWVREQLLKLDLLARWIEKDKSLFQEAERIRGSDRARLEKEYSRAYNGRRYDVAVPGLKKLFYRFRGPVIAHLVACLYALQGKKKEALDWHELSYYYGLFEDDEQDWVKHLERDADMDNVRYEPRFERVLKAGRELRKKRK